ncbi:MAG: hypothetical protein M1366_01080 [Patescibacteria group bacterium]|nr:hypothetical protein [Patescibacteria group bacterium]
MKNMFGDTINGIKTVFQDSSSWKIALGAGAVLAYLYYWLLSQVTTIPTFFSMAQNGEFGKNSILYAILYWATTIATIVFFGISAATLAWLWRHSRLQRMIAGGSNALGVFAGALGSSCPVCGAFLLNAVGITSGVATMPFQGLEFKFASLGLMVGSTVFATRKVKEAENCGECEDITKHTFPNAKPNKKIVVLPLEKVFVSILIGLFIVNQILISQVAAITGLPSGGIGKLLGIKTASAMTIIAPKVNPDGKTTSLIEWPTITEVMANPNSGDALADAKVVMIATGKPFYAPDDISFDDPINAQKKWGAFERSIKLSGGQEARYQKLISTMMTCSYCCGSPTNVTMNKNCGCAHAKAVRGFYRYMIQTYGDQYSDEQLVGESHRWYAIWYPKGMLEDYLLATGRSDALPHQTHGGAGTDGRHGL